MGFPNTTWMKGKQQVKNVVDAEKLSVRSV